LDVGYENLSKQGAEKDEWLLQTGWLLQSDTHIL